MRLVLQRVRSGRVTVDNRIIAEIGLGMVILVGIGQQDTDPVTSDYNASHLAEKIANLRIFEDGQGKINKSILDVGGSVLVVPQFTLYAETRKGRRPSFMDAANPEIARKVVDRFSEFLTAQGVPTQCGEFGAHMLVEIANDGPLTILMEKT